LFFTRVKLRVQGEGIKFPLGNLGEVENIFEIDKIVINGEPFLALKAELPELPPFFLIKGGKGFVICS
jgi:hypothetical protein